MTGLNDFHNHPCNDPMGGGWFCTLPANHVGPHFDAHHSELNAKRAPVPAFEIEDAIQRLRRDEMWTGMRSPMSPGAADRADAAAAEIIAAFAQLRSAPASERIAGFRDGYARALVVSTGTDPRSWDEGCAEIELEAKRYAATVLAPKDSETPEATPLTEAKKKTLREHPAIEAAWGKFAEQMPSGQISRLGLEAALSHLVSTYVNLAWAEEKAEVRAACDTGMRLNLPAAEIVARIRAAIRSASAPEGETPETQPGVLRG